MLVRRIARPLLASSFVYGGIDTLRNPQSRVPGAAPVVEQITAAADQQLPVQVPRDVEQYVKVNAGAQVAAGSLLALGRLPRLSALVLSASLVRSEEHTSELQSRQYLVCRLLLEKKKNYHYTSPTQ